MAGVVDLTLDVAALDLTDPPTRRVLVAVAAALQAPGRRLKLVGITLDRLDEALHAASLTEVFVLRAALRESPALDTAPSTGAATAQRSRLAAQVAAS